MKKHARTYTLMRVGPPRALALLSLAAAGSAAPLAQVAADPTTTATASAAASSGTSRPASRSAMWAMLGILVAAAVVFVVASIAYCLGYKNKRNRNRLDTAVVATRPRSRRRERDPADMSVIDLPLYTNEPAHDEVQLLRRHNTLSEAGHPAPEYLSPTAGVPPYASTAGHGGDDDDEEEGGDHTSPSTSSHRPALRLSTSLAHAARGPSSAGPSRAAPAPILARRTSAPSSSQPHAPSRGPSVRSVRFDAPSRQPSKASLKQRLGAWAESYAPLGDDEDGPRDPWRALSVRRTASPTLPASPSSSASHATYATAAVSLSRRSTADSVTEAQVATVARGRVARAVIAGGDVVFEAPEEEVLADRGGSPPPPLP
ncbi:hypothetical protein Q8F55_000547 [Vanrija albida]|uniref:Uncharacterized protein n=1 Tax=Vanrija albida TaxID=181172 RepID=A0ABR3QDK5_9TREE